MYPQVTQFETRERLAREHVDQLIAHHAVSAAAQARRSRRRVFRSRVVLRTRAMLAGFARAREAAL